MKASALMCRYFLPALCVIAAGFIALSGKDGWGWFLVMAVLLA